MDTDFYDCSGEYVAAFLPQEWDQHRPALLSTLSKIDPHCGPVVDVGSGTGAGLHVIAEALPHAEIFAVEPHRGLRTALLSAIATDSNLRQRVTVLGDDIFSAAIPEQIGVFVAMNMIGHFSPKQRRSLWKLLSNRLAAKGCAVLNFQPTANQSHPGISTSEITLGRHTYRGTAATEIINDGVVSLTMTYHIEENGVIIAETTTTSQWHIFSPQQLAQEITEFGLNVKQSNSAEDLHIITRNS